MKTILSSRRHHHVMRAIIFFLTVAVLIVWMTGCYTCFPKQYELTISSTEGGTVTHPGIGTFTYPTVAIVTLEAEPDEGYQFAKWTGDVSTIDDVNSAKTNITVQGNHAIMANFYEPEIRDWYDLNAIRDNLGGNYTLMNNLNSTTAGYEELASSTANGGKGWEPIGYAYWDSQQMKWVGEEAFRGNFDGQGYEIKDMFTSRPDEDGVGLFKIVYEWGIIKNVRVVNADVTGNSSVGGLVGGNVGGTVVNCCSIGNVTGHLYVGCLVGGSGGIVSNSYANGNVIGISYVGGLVGVNNGNVTNSYSTGSVTGNNTVGGLAGLNMDTVSNSYSNGNVTGDCYVGGLAGVNIEGNVTNCYATGSVTGNSSVGGLVGVNADTVSNSFWDTQTSGQNISAGGTGKNTTEMQDIDTFSGAAWNITTVGGIGERNTTYIWNIVNNVTYPFLSWQPV